MNYIGRKDDGKYISSKKESVEISKYQSCLMAPIGYDATVAETAAQSKHTYRDIFIAGVLGANGFSAEEYLKKRSNDGQDKT